MTGLHPHHRLPLSDALCPGTLPDASVLFCVFFSSFLHITFVIRKTNLPLAGGSGRAEEKVGRPGVPHWGGGEVATADGGVSRP